MDKRSVINNIITSIIGAIIGYGLVIFRDGTTFQWSILGTFILILIAVYAFTGPLYFILKSRKKYDLEGNWVSKWSYQKNRKAVEISESLAIDQYGRFLKGTAISERIDGNHPFTSLKWKFTAIILEGGVIEGKWQNIEPGKNYRGVFQGIIHSSGKIVSIQWLGLENNGIHSGKAEWKSKKL